MFLNITETEVWFDDIFACFIVKKNKNNMLTGYLV